MSVTDELYQLHLIDQQVRGLSTGLKAATAHLQAQQRKLQALRDKHKEITQQHKHAQAAAGTLETEIKGLEQRIEKLRNQMNSATTNKEYSAMLVEINTLKADKGKLEERALEHLTKCDELKAQLTAVDAQIAEQEKLVKLAEQKLAERKSDVGDRLAQEQARRETAARQLPAAVLDEFERLCVATDGEALAEVFQEYPKADFTCGGCYMALPVERINMLASSDQIVRCPSCARILYLATEMKASLASR